MLHGTGIFIYWKRYGFHVSVDIPVPWSIRISWNVIHGVEHCHCSLHHLTQGWLDYWVVVSNIFHFHPYLGKIPILTNIFQMGWNHQLDYLFGEIQTMQICCDFEGFPRKKECMKFGVCHIMTPDKSNEQCSRPWLVVLMGDDKLPTYMGIIISGWCF